MQTYKQVIGNFTEDMLEIKYNKYFIKFEEIIDDILDFSSPNIFYNNKNVEFSQNLKVKITVYQDNLEEYNVVIIGHMLDSKRFLQRESFIIFNENLIVYFDSNIFSFNLPKLNLLWKIDNLCYVFGVYNYKEDLIVYDELSILRIAKSGEIKWQYYGMDHFVSYKGNSSFEMKEDHIELLDSNESFYKIDYDGIVLDDSDARHIIEQLGNLKSESLLKRFFRNLFNKSSL